MDIFVKKYREAVTESSDVCKSDFFACFLTIITICMKTHNVTIIIFDYYTAFQGRQLKKLIICCYQLFNPTIQLTHQN